MCKVWSLTKKTAPMGTTEISYLNLVLLFEDKIIG